MKNGYQIYNPKNASNEAKPLLEQVERHFKFIPNMLGAMVESPQLVQAYLQIDHLSQQTSFSEQERHMLLLAISSAYGCHYSVAAQTAFAQKAGLSSDIIEQMRREDQLNDSRLEAIRQFAIKMVNTGCQMKNQDIANLVANGYARRQILELIMLMTQVLMAVFSNRVMGTDLDEILQSEIGSRAAKDSIQTIEKRAQI